MDSVRWYSRSSEARRSFARLKCAANIPITLLQHTRPILPVRLAGRALNPKLGESSEWQLVHLPPAGSEALRDWSRRVPAEVAELKEFALRTARGGSPLRRRPKSHD